LKEIRPPLAILKRVKAVNRNGEKLEALVLMREDEPLEVVAAGAVCSIEALEDSEGISFDEGVYLYRLPLRCVRIPRPVVVVREGAVVASREGFGSPIVIDLDDQIRSFRVVADKRILSSTENWEEALEIAEEAFLDGAREVELMLFDEEEGIAAIEVFYASPLC
jgi:hypothetical protein